MKRLLSIGIILLFIGMSISSSTGFNLEKESTICGNNEDYQVEFIFIGFILDVEIDKVEGNSYNFYLDCLYTLMLYYYLGELKSVNILKYQHVVKIRYENVIVKGYIGSFFICAKLSFDI